MAAPATAEAIRDVNTRYHDAAAAEYDGKWGIDFHEIGAQQVLGKMRKLLGDDRRRAEPPHAGAPGHRSRAYCSPGPGAAGS